MRIVQCNLESRGTLNKIFLTDEIVFDEGLNFLASDDNTCGKSSIIEAIYYGLGFEEIIGGKGEKVLTSAYKTFIEDNNQKRSVIESAVTARDSSQESYQY